MSIIKLVATVILAVAVLIMITSIQLPTYASPTTEDDGYTYPDDANEEEKDEIDEQEQEAWEDAGRPGDTDNDDNDDNGDDGEQIFTCSDGSTVTEDEECPSTGPNPYCDKVNYAVTCHDRKDYDEDTDLYPCNDGNDKVDWRDCKDATEKSDSNDDDDSTKTIKTTRNRAQLLNIDCETWSHKLDVRLAGHNAQVDLLNSMYNDPMTNEETDRYNAQVDNLNKNGTVLDTEVAGFDANCTTAPPSTQSTTQTTIAIQPEAGVSDGCRNSGFEDGKNSGFNVNTWVHCGGANQLVYYEGFISGCTIYDSFPVDYCENFANGAIK